MFADLEEAQTRFGLQAVTYNIGRPAFGEEEEKKKR
jgi:hypothetical protein